MKDIWRSGPTTTVPLIPLCLVGQVRSRSNWAEAIAFVSKRTPQGVRASRPSNLRLHGCQCAAAVVDITLMTGIQLRSSSRHLANTVLDALLFWLVVDKIFERSLALAGFIAASTIASGSACKCSRPQILLMGKLLFCVATGAF